MKGFIHKLGIVLKELNESRVWLRMSRVRAMVPLALVDPVFKECVELCRIIAVSRRTAQRNSWGRRIQDSSFLIRMPRLKDHTLMAGHTCQVDGTRAGRRRPAA
jgi:hypothetical protein